jgi:uncharacterized membrane protein YdbT with pleckstrin-like domain
MSLLHVDELRPTEITLPENEETLVSTPPSWLHWSKLLTLDAYFVLAGLFVLLGGAIALALLLWFLAVLLGVYVYVHRLYSRYTVTTDRVHKQIGLLHQTTSEARIADIHSLSTEASLLERLCGLGTVQIDSTGAAGLLSLDNLPNHKQVANTIREQQQNVAKSSNPV